MAGFVDRSVLRAIALPNLSSFPSTGWRSAPAQGVARIRAYILQHLCWGALVALVGHTKKGVASIGAQGAGDRGREGREGDGVWEGAALGGGGVPEGQRRWDVVGKLG